MNFTLTNDIAPKPAHPDNCAFKQDSPQAILRQRIWQYLAARPQAEIPLQEIVEAVGEKYAKVYRAARQLCMKHLVVRKNEERFIVREKTQEKVKLKPIIKLRFVEPFASRKGSEDGTARTLW